VKSSSICKICNEEIFIESNNWLQNIASDAVLVLKCHIHLKTHGKRLLTLEGIFRRIIIVILTFLLAFLVLPVWLVTLPFWWIHEQIS